MTPREVLAELTGRGFALRVKDGGKLGVSPADRLTADDLVLIREHRAALLALLGAADGCATCAHRTQHRNCAEPVAACLAQHFSIVWLDLVPNGGRWCKAWTQR